MRIKDSRLCSYYMQLLNHKKKNIFLQPKRISSLVIHDHYLTREHQMYFLNRFSSIEIYNFLISQKEETTLLRQYY